MVLKKVFPDRMSSGVAGNIFCRDLGSVDAVLVDRRIDLATADSRRDNRLRTMNKKGGSFESKTSGWYTARCTRIVLNACSSVDLSRGPHSSTEGATQPRRLPLALGDASISDRW